MGYDYIINFFFGLFVFALIKILVTHMYLRYFSLRVHSRQIFLWYTFAIDFYKAKCNSFTLSLLNFIFLVFIYPYSISRFWNLVMLSIILLSALSLSFANFKSMTISIEVLKKKVEQCKIKKWVLWYTNWESPLSCPQFNNLHSGHCFPISSRSS